MVRVVVTTHAERRMKARLGSGCDPLKIALRCWERMEDPPEDWQVLRDGHSRYFRYGNHCFVFNWGKHGDNSMCLVTVVGPLSKDKPWVKQNLD